MLEVASEIGGVALQLHALGGGDAGGDAVGDSHINRQRQAERGEYLAKTGQGRAS